MPEIPEHLLKRSAERRKQLGLPTGEEGGETRRSRRARRRRRAAPRPRPRHRRPPRPRRPAPSGDAITEDKGGVPAHLLERSRRRKAALVGGGDAGAAAPAAAAAGGGTATATAVKAAPAPTMTGPGGHTQRLLTVVKSGSIQQTRAEAQDKVHTWPHLLVVEFAAILAMTAVVLDLLGHRARAAARPRRRQPDAEPVEGAVVLPRSAGAAHDVPPDGRGRDHPGHGPLPADRGAVRRQEPVAQARGPEVRDLASSRSS